MIGKRLLWFSVGVGVGAGAAIEGRRRIQRALRQRTPSAVAGRIGASARGMSHDVREAFATGRDAMRAREAELRADRR